MSGTFRRAYDDVVVTVPVTIPYVRYSIHGAHWFAARALAGLLSGSGLRKSDIDGLCMSSFTLAPDTAVGLTQHLGLSLRWLDHIPMGGAAGVIALRRALRAVESGDAGVVACVAASGQCIEISACASQEGALVAGISRGAAHRRSAAAV